MLNENQITPAPVRDGAGSFEHVLSSPSHSATAMKHSEAAVLTVADLADLFTEDSEGLE